MKEKLFQTVEELFPEYFQLWQDVCNLESPTQDKAGVDAVGRFLESFAVRKGWQVERCAQAVSGDALCVTMNPDAENAPVVLSGHMDTVHPVGSFGSPAVHQEGDFLVGPGVVDCKGGIVASCMAMDALAHCGFEKKILLLLQSDEETSSRGSNQDTLRFMAEKSRGCVGFLNTEASSPKKVTLSRKGILKYEFTVTGKAAHAGSCFAGANAIAEAAQKILQIETRKEKDGITCNVGTIQGGTTTNTVPESCTFTVDCRFRNAQQEAELRAFMEQVAAQCTLPQTVCCLRLLSSRCSMPDTAKNRELLAKINAVLIREGMDALEPEFRYGGSDAANMTQAGIPCLDCFGVSGSGLHTTHEKAEIASLTRSAKLMALLCAALA